MRWVRVRVTACKILELSESETLFDNEDKTKMILYRYRTVPVWATNMYGQKAERKKKLR